MYLHCNNPECISYTGIRIGTCYTHECTRGCTGGIGAGLAQSWGIVACWYVTDGEMAHHIKPSIINNHTGIVLSSLLETPAAAPLGEGRPVAEQADVDEDARQRAVQRALNRYRLLTTAVTAFGLEGAHTWKPLLDGKQVGGWRVVLRGAPCTRWVQHNNR